MAQIKRSMRLYHKAEAALIAGLEVYNKPSFSYREETFSILMLNAWELLLKAKLLADNSNDLRCLYVYERRPTRKGTLGKKEFLKKNRAGNVQTKSFGQVLVALDRTPATRLPQAVKDNLDALTAIRDNAVHYMNPSFTLAKQVLEIGTASVKNFVELAKRWFRQDLSGYNLFLMPIGFLAPRTSAHGLVVSPDEQKLIDYLTGLMADQDADGDDDFHVALRIDLIFQRSTGDAAMKVAVSNDPAAPKVTLSEEDVRRNYPWDYAELVRRCQRRYSDFKQNQRFHDIRKPLLQDRRFVHPRFLDPGNPRSQKKDFYNPNVLQELDEHYTRK
jgi:hypothetical protein